MCSLRQIKTDPNNFQYWPSLLVVVDIVVVDIVVPLLGSSRLTRVRGAILPEKQYAFYMLSGRLQVNAIKNAYLLRFRFDNGSLR